jgi:hypothetical protein
LVSSLMAKVYLQNMNFGIFTCLKKSDFTKRNLQNKPEAIFCAQIYPV